MKSAKQFLQQIDEYLIESIAHDLRFKLTESMDKEDIEAFVYASPIEAYKRNALLEYIDKNKDKLLAMDVYNEGDPVKVDDDYAPHARKHGKVISKGAVEGSYKVEFEDGQYDVPAHHITRRDAVANEGREPTEHSTVVGHSGEKKKIHKMITEMKCLALMEDGSLLKVMIESFDNAEQLVSEQVGQRALVVFPTVINETFESSLTEAEMTDEQKAKREEIVMAMKKNKKELQKRYGHRWESVMYAVATYRVLKMDKV